MKTDRENSEVQQNMLDCANSSLVSPYAFTARYTSEQVDREALKPIREGSARQNKSYPQEFRVSIEVDALEPDIYYNII